ncbi:hypothetical protein FJY71_08820, partial [candidate division WOR-3 bacterium]|nr:hypothetical protein [candidate division WOR-3 bacterium]
MRPTLGLLTAAVMLSGSAVAARLDSAAAPVSRRGLATLASAALPGTGQLLLGTRVRGEVMLWTDAALWSLWGGSTWLGASRERDARLVASAKAGADLGQTDRRYYRALERYDNSDEYNEDVRREARARYPDDPDAQRRYYEANSYSGE